MNPFKKEFCPSCNKELIKTNFNTMSTKDVYCKCEECNINIKIEAQANRARGITISFDKNYFTFYENNEFFVSEEIFSNDKSVSPFRSVREIIFHEKDLDNLSEISSIKEAYDFCLKIKDNLLFL